MAFKYLNQCHYPGCRHLGIAVGIGRSQVTRDSPLTDRHSLYLSYSYGYNLIPKYATAKDPNEERIDNVLRLKMSSRSKDPELPVNARIRVGRA